MKYLANRTGLPIRVAIADDHPLLREGVRSVVSAQHDMILVGEAGNGAEAIDLYRSLQPDIMLLDMQTPVLDGACAVARIRAEFPRARIVALTSSTGDIPALRTLQAGASGYLLKKSLSTELLHAIRAVFNGGKYLHSEVARSIALHVADQPLTDREREVLQLVAEGSSNKQIAAKLHLAEDTVKGHMKAIFAKLGASDRTHAVTLAARRGAISI